jgi:iron complex outermembrane receptor protein
LATFLAPQPFAVPPIDLYNPTYGGINRPATVPPNTLYTIAQSWTGLYAQDQITVAKRLHLLVGGRVDWMNVTTQLSTTAQPSPSATRHDRLFSPRVGFVYEFTPQVSIYGNYARSFLGNYFWTSQPYAPETSRQFEGGIKTSWWQERVTATLAVYEILKHNMLMADPNNPPLNIPVGEARSRGIEVDITGQVTPNLSLIGAFAYTDTRVTQDSTGNQNHRLPNVPLQSGSLWAKYAFRDGALRGLSLGTGVFLAAQRQGDVANSFQLPGYGRLDAMAAYRWPVRGLRMTAQLNVNNLLNQRYYESANTNEAPRLLILPAAPLMAIGSLRIEY